MNASVVEPILVNLGRKSFHWYSFYCVQSATLPKTEVFQKIFYNGILFVFNQYKGQKKIYMKKLWWRSYLISFPVNVWKSYPAFNLHNNCGTFRNNEYFEC